MGRKRNLLPEFRTLKKVPMKREPNTLKNQIAAVKAEIEKLKLAKLQAAQGLIPSACIDQETIPYEDIQIHPEDQQMLTERLTAQTEMFDRNRAQSQRRWYLSLVQYAP